MTDVAAIEFSGRYTLDNFTQLQKLRLPIGKRASRATHKVVHRGGTNNEGAGLRS